MSYPIGLTDVTKLNFTLTWSNPICPQALGSILECSPNGGFAVVFQQEGPTALGEFKNNNGEGMGFNGLSGVFAVAFDTHVISDSQSV